MNGLVSIIIPVYNRQQYINECIDSVLKQSYKNYEVVIIDDGSTDNTVEICEELCQKHSFINLLKAEHKGVCAARNMGLDVAKGEFVFFLDSDDVIHPLLLENLVNALEQKNADVAAPHILAVNQQNWKKVYEIISKNGSNVEVIYNDTEKTLKGIFFDYSPLNIMGGVMMRKSLIGQTRFNTGLFIGEDFYFIYENLIKGVTSAIINKKWYYERLHDNNSSWCYDFDGFMTRFMRRKLVWESEEKLGRIQNANQQKRESFGCYTNCLVHNKPSSAHVKRMQKEIKKYNRIILSAFGLKNKFRYLLAVYMPSVYMFALRITKKG